MTSGLSWVPRVPIFWVQPRHVTGLLLRRVPACVAGDSVTLPRTQCLPPGSPGSSRAPPRTVPGAQPKVMEFNQKGPLLSVFLLGACPPDRAFQRLVRQAPGGVSLRPLTSPGQGDGRPLLARTGNPVAGQRRLKHGARNHRERWRCHIKDLCK